MKYICIGKIVNTHGLRGELKINSYSDFNAERYKKGNTIFVKEEDHYLSFVVKTYREHKGQVLVSFVDHENINLVEKYKGCEVYIDKASQHPLPEGQYYRHELIDFVVYDQDNNEIGKVISIEETNGAQNNMRVQTKEKEMLIPFVPAFIKAVDKEKQTITIQVVEGLL